MKSHFEYSELPEYLQAEVDEVQAGRRLRRNCALGFIAFVCAALAIALGVAVKALWS